MTLPAEERLEPRGLGARIRDTCEATRDVWGDAGVEDILARVGMVTRRQFAPGARPPAWVAERVFVEWTNAAWDARGQDDAASFARWTDRVTDRGFGSARRLLLSLASPELILRRAHSLWRTEHTHGTLTVAWFEPRAVRVALRAHPFASESDATRAAVSEALRHIVSLCRVSWAKETHERGGDSDLHVHLTWG